MQRQRTIAHGTEASNLADILERILDKGVVIAGDIQIKIADIELLTITIRLFIGSVERAKEMGIDWWEGNPYLKSVRSKEEFQRMEEKDAEIEGLKKRLAQLESVNQQAS